ncbi:MAG: beta-propeller domain-containing protein [Deltaproteobacteria bacterium]|nr:beta-propeller domain-containing protein [Deltaproteobacteria bacterium]
MGAVAGLKRRGQVWGVLGFAVLARCAAGEAQDMAGPGGAQERDGQSDVATEDRVLQESDIFKREGDLLYVLNRFRGLYVADLTQRDAPRLLGRVKIPAQPREMWVRNQHAYVITSQQQPYGWGWWWNQTSGDVETWARYAGSALAVADVSDPEHPVLAAMVPLDGDCHDGRLRGNVLYLACSADFSSTGVAGPHGRVYSFDLSTPATPAPIADVVLPGEGEAQHVHVTDDYMFVADQVQGSTRVSLVDIRGAGGTLEKRGAFSVPAWIPDRFAMDAWQGSFRVATGPQFGNGDVYLTTFDMADPDNPVQQGQVIMHVDEELKSARFDGARGYVVTFKRVDPLFIFDLSDPTAPRRMGELQMSGWLDFMVPMGDRLVAMGHEQIEEEQRIGWFGWRAIRRTLAVSLIDVAGDPSLLSRVVLDGNWGTIPAERDDYNKLFRVFAPEGLVVFPYRTFNDWGSAGDAGMLLIDLQNDTLTQRADLRGLGLVERGILWDPQTLVTLSVQCLQVLDITDRSAPAQLARLDLAGRVSQFVKVADDVVVEMAGDLSGGQARLTAWRVGQIADGLELGSVRMEAPSGVVAANGALVFFASVHKPQPYYWGYGSEAQAPPAINTKLTVVDFADPGHPVIRGEVTLDDEVIYDGEYWGWYGADRSEPMVQAQPGVLALHRPTQWKPSGGCMGYRSEPARIYLVDARNPDAPVAGGRWQAGDNAYMTGLYGAPGRVFTSGSGFSVISTEDPGNPHEVANVGGTVLAVSPSDGRVLTLEYRCDQESRWGGCTNGRNQLVLRQANGDNINELARVDNADWGYTAEFVDDRVVVSTGGTLQVRDATAGGGLAQLASVPFASDYYSVQFTGGGNGHFFLANGSLVELWSVGDNGVPLMRSTFSLAGHGGTGAVVGGHAVVAGGFHGLVATPVTQQ